MANIKIAQLTNQINIADTDLIIVESATSTNKMTVGKLKELLGIQAGGVVELGSNANGNYVKYSSGIMICYRTLPCAYNTAIRLRGTWTFPIPFISAPTLSAEKSYSTSGTRQINSSVHIASKTVAEATIDLVQIVNSSGSALVEPWQTTDVYGADCIAIGRWK